MSEKIDAIIDFADHPVEVEAYRPDPEKVLSGDPVQQAWNHYSDPSNRFHAGIWQGEPGSARIAYTEHELCHLLEGSIVLHDEAGGERRFKAGDVFVIPAGFRGVWETVETCRKIYAIYEPQD